MRCASQPSCAPSTIVRFGFLAGSRSATRLKAENSAVAFDMPDRRATGSSRRSTGTLREADEPLA